MMTTKTMMMLIMMKFEVIEAEKISSRTFRSLVPVQTKNQFKKDKI